ncbi:MAG: hypothetical protein II799_00385, partial [Lachnospiraceae bacterium]|nr:hypothetical protein [Lachnospiraceae bacterium]
IATVSRRLTKGRSNKLLFAIIIFSLCAAACDFLNYAVVWYYPLEQWKVTWVFLWNYGYFIFRYSLTMLYIFFFYSVSHTWFKIKDLWKKILIALPCIIILVMYTANLWLGNLYSVNAETGYHRGSGIAITAVLGSVYLIYGIVLLVVDKKYMELSEWLSVGSIFAFNILGIIIQGLKDNLIIESYFTAISILFLVLYVQKPEQQLDLDTGLPCFYAFRDTIKRIELTGQKVQVVMAFIENADELNKFMGDEAYLRYIHVVERAIAAYARAERLSYEFYFDEPGVFYLVLDDVSYNPVQGISDVRDRVQRETKEMSDTGVRVVLKVVTVKFPEEVDTADSLIHLSQRFLRYTSQKIFYHAPQIIDQRNYQIERRFDEIYKRTTDGQGIKMFYRPVWSESQKKSIFAEAGFSIIDDEFGEIDGDTVKSIARIRGAISVLEKYLLEQVFSFVGSGAMTRAGLDHIVINLSPALAMQKTFTDQIWNLRSQTTSMRSRSALVFPGWRIAAPWRGLWIISKSCHCRGIGYPWRDMVAGK